MVRWFVIRLPQYCTVVKSVIMVALKQHIINYNLRITSKLRTAQKYG